MLPAKVQCTLFWTSTMPKKNNIHKGIYRVMVWNDVTGIDANIITIYIVGILFSVSFSIHFDIQDVKDWIRC